MIAAMTSRTVVHRLAAFLCAATVLATSTQARAADDDEQPDARTAGYSSAAPASGRGEAPDVGMKSSSVLSIVTLAFLGAVTVGFMFKNANRSDVD